MRTIAVGSAVLVVMVAMNCVGVFGASQVLPTKPSLPPLSNNTAILDGSANGAASSSSPPNADKDIIYWEDIMLDAKEPAETKNKKTVKRKLFWTWNDFNDPFDAVRPKQRPAKHKDTGTQSSVPHPMRTDEWKLNISCRKRNSGLVQDMDTLEFSENGYVRVLPKANDDRHGEWCKPAIGTWELLPSGIAFTIPVEIATHSRNMTTVLRYHADIHMNQFGTFPKMTRGVISRDRFPTSRLPKHLFRPIVAKFTAVGIGEDTSDVSYQERGFGT